MTFQNTTYNVAPYYDDFDATKKFLRVLFRPGFSVQARELTQVQTILQNQIHLFGNHVFENGSLVSGGQTSESTVYYGRIDPSTLEVSTDDGDTYSSVASDDVSSVLATIIDAEFGIGTNSYDDGIGRILHTLKQNDDTTDTFHYMFFDYIDGASTLGSGDRVELLNSGDGYRYRFNIKTTGSDSLPPVGRCRMVSTQAGIYYVDGHFVISEEQRVVPYNIATSTNRTDGTDLVAIGGKMFVNPSARIGFTSSNEVTTFEDDSTLGDPASGSTNFSAPGADRFAIVLSLGFSPFTSGVNSVDSFASDNFFEILRYDSGTVTKRETLPDYAVLEETLARRSFDESGNYTLTDFDLQVREHFNDGVNEGVYSAGDTEKLVAILEPGKAYIGGYEKETISRTYIDLDKARTTDEESTKVIDINVGNYVIIGASAGAGAANGFGEGVDFINSQDHPVVHLATSVGTTFGSALFRQIDVENAGSDQYRFYIYDIELNSSGDFGETSYIFTEAGATIGVIDETLGFNSAGEAIQFLPTSDSLVVPLPITEATSTVKNLNWDTQLSFEATAASGQIQVSVPSKAGDPILFPGDVNAAVAGSLLNNRYFLINRTANAYIDDFTGITFTTSNDNETVTVTGLVNGNDYTLIANCEITTDNSSFFYRTKTLEAAQSVTGITIESLDGITFGELGFSDIYVLDSVVGESDAPGTNLTSRYDLDNGQRDNLYDHGRIMLKAGATAGDSVVTATFRRFSHSGDGPFVLDSYPVGTAYSGATFGYENIPSFTSNKTGETISLRSAVDFRPVKASDGTVTDAWIPVAKESASVSFEYYLPRIDKIILDANREFKVIKGIPALSPQIPADDPNGLTLYTARLGSYTFDASDVEVKKHRTRRFTMADIGSIEQRVDNLEYFSSLSLLEQDANARIYIDSSGNVIPKAGIIVDNFNGHEVADINNKDYNCAMDFDAGLLRAAFTSKNISLVEDDAITLQNVVSYTPAADESNDAEDSRNSLYMLAFDAERSVANPLADSTINPNPTGRIDWDGYLSLSPESDDWYYDAQRANVRLNKYGVNDAWDYRSGTHDNSPYGFGTQWRDWEYNWFGKLATDLEFTKVDLNEDSRKIFDKTFDGASTAVRDRNHDTLVSQRIGCNCVSGSARKLLTQNATPDSILKAVGERIVNKAVQPYNRAITVRYAATHMKPNTSVSIFADNDLLGTGTTDSAGKISGSFNFTEGTLRTGDVLVRIIDNSDNDIALATTVSEAIFKLGGAIDTNGNHVRTSQIRRSSTTDSTVPTSLLSRTLVDGSGIQSLDSLAQNFTVDRNKFAKGAFFESVDLLIARKPDLTSQKDLPITIEIRPTISGYPDPARIVPGSIVSKSSDSVVSVGSTDFEASGARTKFTFEYPIYLEPGEYSIIVRTNSDRYLVYSSSTGNELATNERISNQPNVGAMFKPQNAGTYIPVYNESLSFAMNRCKFRQSAGSVVFRNRENDILSDFKYDSYYIHSTYLDFGKESFSRMASFQIQTTPENGSLSSTPKTINMNQTIVPLESDGTQIVETVDKTIVLTASLTTDDDAISPVIDAQRLSFVAIQNNINESSSEVSDRLDVEYNGELDAIILDSIDSTKVSSSRYMTKSVVLEEGVTASDLRVILDINKPAGTDIQVFGRVLSDTDTVDLDEKSFVELDPETVYTSPNTKEYREITYKSPLSTDFGSFGVFQIKIVMHSNDAFTTPKVKDMRAIALA